MSTRILREVSSVIMISLLDENIISECYELIESLIMRGLNSSNNRLRMYFFVEEDIVNALDEMMTFYASSDMIMNIVSTEIDTLLAYYNGRIVNIPNDNSSLIVNKIPSKLRKSFNLEIHVENNNYCDIIYIDFCPESTVF